MLFNSYDFLFGFLPICLLGHHLLLRRGGLRGAWLWLVAASLFYYGYWYPPYVLLIVASMVANYGVGQVVAAESRSVGLRKAVLTAGITANLAVLAWFKYAAFFDANVLALTGVDLGLVQVALPLAISFFTFQQIAYLVDAWRGQARAYDFLDYTLFVTFFPQLISGPIVHHSEMIPQFREGKAPTSEDRAVGLTMLVIGLAKKVLIADTMGIHADHAFGVVSSGHLPSVLMAWTGAIAFYFEVYFDFSGYSDMAVGLARLFGIKLPVNFDAPYRADSMIELWRRWHMTLSRFLRDYLYIPLGGSRAGKARRYANLFITMVLGGLWHGAAWTFVFWGFLHGSYLLLNHAWRAVNGGPATDRRVLLVGRTLTQLGFLNAAVFFRADSFDDAVAMHAAMVGIDHSGIGSMPSSVPWLFLATFALVQLAPTSQRWLERYEPVLGELYDTLRWPAPLTWRPTLRWGIVLGVLAVLCLPFLERADPFIYFQF
ncbi:MAG: MBOAT family protein [Alphaproteobacteria bacterium]|nr:MBOAT family protein [Alphaproteobacteria bacterium]